MLSGTFKVRVYVDNDCDILPEERIQTAINEYHRFFEDMMEPAFEHLSCSHVESNDPTVYNNVFKISYIIKQS